MIVKQQGIDMSRLTVILYLLIPLAMLTPSLSYAQSSSIKGDITNTKTSASDNERTLSESIKDKKKHKKEKMKEKKPKYESVNINNASAKELMMALKGIGKKKANAIIEYRNKNGDFKVSDDLMKVKGIGKKLINKNEGRIRLSGKNTL